MTISTEAHKPLPFSSAVGSLIEATDAIKNFRAIVLLALTFIGAVLVGGVLMMLAGGMNSAVLAFLGGLMAFLVMFYGSNAVGILLMRDAQGQPGMSLVDAVLVSLYTSHRLIAVVFLEFLIVLAAMFAIAIILFVCKIPVLGPVLYAVVFPLSAIVLGVLVFALFYVMLPLAGPAAWSGASVFQIIARLNQIVRTKLVSVILLEVLLFMMTSFVALLIFGVLGAGVSLTTGMSAGILGLGSQMNMYTLASGLGGGGGSGYIIAAGLGGGLLMAAAAVVPGLIFTKGVCIIYLNATRNVDFSASEASLNEGLAVVKKKAEEARERARTLAEQATAPAAPAAPADSLQCPNCKAPVASDDVFCGECAHKLK
ncbi:zinc ribbon domain-containing protein [Janthinobacterium sp. PAMC25594]|uniref:zinc ribbon domain-containing protein n=1 Tax=Janthinobacterium sp. PAMC25594 TaxID=2861284 RepID=UPI001C6278F6|nr:zinc ribbon domain-containing protein [Janthinobacterium sp. PAMC25594]QYG05375.1 zinc ribbon domain-containing protein [Janthinobacterium sp. PAMC25594]